MWSTMPGRQRHGARFRPRPPAGLTELEGDERGVDAESEPARLDRVRGRDIEEPDAALRRRRG